MELVIRQAQGEAFGTPVSALSSVFRQRPDAPS
jgi:hypothetical protein